MFDNLRQRLAKILWTEEEKKTEVDQSNVAQVREQTPPAEIAEKVETVEKRVVAKIIQSKPPEEAPKAVSSPAKASEEVKKQPQKQGFKLSRQQTLQLIEDFNRHKNDKETSKVGHMARCSIIGQKWGVSESRVYTIMKKWAEGYYEAPPTHMKRMTKEQFEKAKTMSGLGVEPEVIATAMGIDEERVSEALKVDNYNKFRMMNDR